MILAVTPEILDAFGSIAETRAALHALLPIGPIPEGTFFACTPANTDSLQANDIDEYMALLRIAIGESPHYNDQEKQESIGLRTPEHIQAKLDNPDWILLGAKNEDGRLIGSIEATILTSPAGQRIGNIKWTLVHPDARQQGIATLLKRTLEEELRGRGCIGILTAIKDTNTASIEMNRKLGVVPEPTLAQPAPDMRWYAKYFD